MPDVEYVKQIDKRLLNVRTGDVALTTRDDFPSMLISYFTFSNCQHSAIFAWIDRDEYENKGKVIFIPRNKNNDILLLCHITKRRMHDIYTNSKRNGLVLCTLDNYCKDHLITVWNKEITRKVSDEIACESFSRYFSDNYPILEYENDIRCILGVPLGTVYRPYPHRMICTAMVCDYLHSSYGYPFLLSENGLYFDEPYDTNKRVIDFKFPNREFDVYRAFDFFHTYNQSPVFESKKEDVVYGNAKPSIDTLLHPYTLIAITMLFMLILLIVLYFILDGTGKTLWKMCCKGINNIIGAMSVTYKKLCPKCSSI